jgi:small subunit ribosomal protein S6
MPLYEHVFIARQDAAQAQVDALIEELKGIVATGGGEVTKSEYWGLRSLTYRIKKNRKGHYVLLGIDAPAPAVHELERRQGLNEDVIRSLTIRVEEMEAEPSVGMQAKHARDRRDQRWGRRDDEEGGFGGEDRGFGGDRDRGDRGDRADRGDREVKGDRT